MLDFYSKAMLLKWEWNEHQLQKCPYCNMGHPIYVDGMTRAYGTNDTVLNPEIGYSFCNCKNIWYTNWENIWKHSYNDDYMEKYENDVFKKNAFIHVEKIISNFHRLKKDISSFIDIGCGSLFLLDDIKDKLGWNTTGFDINKLLKTDKHNMIYGDADFDLDKLPVSDVIWCSHVLEHLEDPLKSAKELQSKLTDGGLLYISMPDPYFINFKQPAAWEHWWVHEHRMFWDMDSFARELFEMGYIIKHLQHNSNHMLMEFNIIASKPTDTEKKFLDIVDRRTGVIEVPIDTIDPNDQAHDENNIDEAHRKGINWIKEQYESNQDILPIAVNYYGKRLDGFKRFIAQKELGYKTIKVFIDTKNKGGCQHGECFQGFNI